MSWIHFSTKDLNDYGAILVFLVIGICLSCLFMVLAAIRGARNPYDEKNSAYECGFSPIGSLEAPFSVRFCLVSVLFIIFDIEIALLFPWAMVLRKIGWAGFVSVLFFLSTLTVGFIYEWRSGALDWE
jgi:NADH-quinone oxidoreductase subunit A